MHQPARSHSSCGSHIHLVESGEHVFGAAQPGALRGPSVRVNEVLSPGRQWSSLAGQQPARPVGDAEPLRRRLQRAQHDRQVVVVRGLPALGRSASPSMPSVAYRRFQAITVGLLTPTSASAAQP